ncbi:hypothetical protein MOBT1_000954 [Malassezia obtusa]|uniref:Uncharacterized protein n=1 Tax=Malassezia obtusa TaxID=76774 RepID=A0AAF0DZ86_9BASI|nr:hypothetical protein MOBT1_000954 [Malassezia obtusa]
MVPDGVLHPKFAQKKLGRGMWVCNDQRVVQRLHDRQMHRVVAPDASLSPHLRPMLTYQFQQRLVQEAELLLERVRHRRIAAETKHEAALAVRLLDTTEGGQARRALPGAGFEYALPHLMPDAALREALWQVLASTARRGPRLCTPVDAGYAVAQHAATAPLCVALWRASSWMDSRNE